MSKLLKIVFIIGVTLSFSVIAAAQDSANPQAQALYDQANTAYFDNQDPRRAIALLDSAIALDSQFGRAYLLRAAIPLIEYDQRGVRPSDTRQIYADLVIAELYVEDTEAVLTFTALYNKINHARRGCPLRVLGLGFWPVTTSLVLDSDCV